LFFEYARLVKEIQPKVFIYENVRNLLNHDHGHTWDVIREGFEALGYTYTYAVLNAADYGIPQTRRRLFVVGFKNGDTIHLTERVEDYFSVGQHELNYRALFYICGETEPVVVNSNLIEFSVVES